MTIPQFDDSIYLKLARSYITLDILNHAIQFAQSMDDGNNEVSCEQGLMPIDHSSFEYHVNWLNVLDDLTLHDEGIRNQRDTYLRNDVNLIAFPWEYWRFHLKDSLLPFITESLDNLKQLVEKVQACRVDGSGGRSSSNRKLRRCYATLFVLNCALQSMGQERWRMKEK